MSTTASRDRRPVATVVGAVSALGAVSLVVAAFVVPLLPEPLGSQDLHSPWAVVAFIAAAAITEIVYVPLVHGDGLEHLTFYEIVTVAGILVLDPSLAVAAPLIGLAIVSIALRTPPVKALFNLGSYATATVGAVITYLAIVGGTDRFAARGVIGIVAAMVVFAVVNTLLLSAILHAAQGIPRRDVIADVWALSLLMTVGSIGVGAVAVAVAPVSPLLLPFTTIPALALWYAYRSAATRAEERERNRWLVTLSGVLTAERPLPEMVAEVSEAIRMAFGAGVVEVALPADDAIATTFPAADGPVPVPSAKLPAGWSSGVSVGLELDSGRRGTLLLGNAEGVSGRNAWALKQTDEAVLMTVAASLSSAIRGAARLTALVEESSKMRAVVEHASDGIAVLTGAGSVRLWSPAMVRITGVTEPQAAATDAEVPEAVTALVALATDHGRVTGYGPVDVVPRTVTLTRPDGDTRDVSVAVVSARPGTDGEPVAILTVHDVTAQARADRLKSDFVATISHELRTPITPIKGYAQLLLARGDAMTPERRKAAYELIAERADHLGRLVEDLLMASRASGTLGSKLATAPEQHDLRTVVAAAVSSFPALDSRLVVEQPSGAVPVWCDSVRTVQILSNLLSNAAKYSPEGTPVSVRIPDAEFGDTHAFVSVSDEGCGLSEADRERVFERFYRVEDSMTMRTPGSGLGLYIARELAIAMGGDLSVSSQPGKGSTFTVRLPRTAPESSTTQSHEFRRTA